MVYFISRRFRFPPKVRNPGNIRSDQLERSLSIDYTTITYNYKYNICLLFSLDARGENFTSGDRATLPSSGLQAARGQQQLSPLYACTINSCQPLAASTVTHGERRAVGQEHRAVPTTTVRRTTRFSPVVVALRQRPSPPRPSPDQPKQLHRRVVECFRDVCVCLFVRVTVSLLIITFLVAVRAYSNKLL